MIGYGELEVKYDFSQEGPQKLRRDEILQDKMKDRLLI